MKITAEILKEWKACTDGFKVFCELMPDGAELDVAIKILDEAGHGFGCTEHDDWSYWIFNKARNDSRFIEATAKGYRNSGYRNSGHRNSGHRNSGNRNSGHRNSGDWNSGYRNSGNRNSGDWNSGDWNSGDWNSGYRNSGDWNSGYRNSGDWNSGNRNSGYFNTDTPKEILVFNKLCSRELFDSWYKPRFLNFDLTVWVDEAEMSDEAKKLDPMFYVIGGQLVTKNYKEAFQESYAKASPEDRAKIKNCPNFDADLFYEISGIRVE